MKRWQYQLLVSTGATGTFVYCLWEYKMTQPLWKFIGNFFKKLNLHLSYDPAIAPLGISPKNWRQTLKRCLYTHLLSSSSHNSQKWKQLKCPSTDEWITKNGVYTHMEYFSALKRKEVLIHTTTWMNLEDIILSEISQSQKDKYLYDSTYMRHL